MECIIKKIKIYYEVYGEGFPILMLHGWGIDHRMMKGCMEPIFQTMDKAWKRIYFDLPGMGSTIGEADFTGPETIFEVVLGFIDKLMPKEHFLVAGDSYGGLLARGLINKRSSFIDGLLLICPCAGQGRGQFQVFEKDDELLSSLKEEDRTYFEAEGINTTRNQRVWRRYKEEIIPGIKSIDYSFLVKCQGGIDFDVDALKTPYTKPTLMLAGRQDSIVGYQGLWNLIELYPRASFVLLDKAGHALQIEQEHLFTETVKEWLGRVTAYTCDNN